MSLRTEDSLNCPCNGIFKCGLHSVPKFVSPCIQPLPDEYWPSLHLANIKRKEYGTEPHWINPYTKEDIDKFMKYLRDN